MCYHVMLLSKIMTNLNYIIDFKQSYWLKISRSKYVLLDTFSKTSEQQNENYNEKNGCLKTTETRKTLQPKQTAKPENILHSRSQKWSR